MAELIREGVRVQKAFMAAVLIGPTTTTKKVQQSVYGSWASPEGSRKVEESNRHVKMVRLSALSTGRFYPPGNISGTHFC
jgi:hypothetical protein